MTKEHVLAQNKDNYTEVMAAIIISVVGMATFLGLPVIVGSLVDGYHFSEEQIGYYSAIGMSGSIISSILVSIVAKRVNRKMLLLVGCILGAIGYTISATMHDFDILLIAAFIAGLGGGTMYALGLALIAATHHTGKNFSILMFSQGVFSGLELYFLPKVSASFGTEGVFVAIGLAFIIVIPLILLVSSHYKFDDDVNSNTEQNGSKSLTPWLSLAAIFFFYLAVGSFWTYVERLGLDIGLSLDAVSDYLTLGNLLALTGCGIAYWLIERVGEAKPLLIAMLSMSISFALLSSDDSVNVYIFSVLFFFLLWNFIDVFQLSTLSHVGDSNYHVPLVPAFQSIAVASGPAISGFLLGSGWDLSNIMLLNSGILVMALLCLLLIFTSLHSKRAPRQNKSVEFKTG